MDVRLSPKVTSVTGLPDGLDILRAEAAAEGFGLEVLWSEWRDGTNRFNRPGELLAVATVEDDLAGIGGITEDFIDPAWLRMRRFYVRAAYRRSGVGRAIARFILDRALPLRRQIVLHAASADAAAFWQTLGFEPIERDKTTHQFPSHKFGKPQT